MKKILILLVVLVLSCEEDDDSNVRYKNSDGVEYSVQCTPSGFDVTYNNSSGNTQQEEIKTGSWSKKESLKKGDFMYISAQADNEDAEITVKIYCDGILEEIASSEGDYVIATASGTVP